MVIDELGKFQPVVRADADQFDRCNVLAIKPEIMILVRLGRAIGQRDDRAITNDDDIQIVAKFAATRVAQF